MQGIFSWVLGIGVIMTFWMCGQSHTESSLISMPDEAALDYPPKDSTLPVLLQQADSLIQWRQYVKARILLDSFLHSGETQSAYVLNRAKNMWCYIVIRSNGHDSDQAFQVLQQLEMTGDREDTLILGQRALNLGYYYQAENPDSAAKYFDEALFYTSTYFTWDDPSMQRYYSDIGSYYFFDGYQTLKALDLVQKEEGLHGKWKYAPFARYVLFYNLGVIHRELEDFDLAERYTLQAVAELRTHGMDTLDNIVFPYASLCYMFAEKNDSARLNLYVDTTLGFVNRFYQHDLSERIDYYSTLALCYGPGYVNKPERGLAILEFVPAYSPDLQDQSTSYAQVNRSKAYLYAGMGNLKKAQQCMRDAIALFEDEDMDQFDVSGYTDAHLGLGIFYLEDGNRVTEAMPHVMKAAENMFNKSLDDVVHSLDIRYLKYYDRWFDYYVAYGDYLLWKSDPTLVSDILRLSARIDSAIVTTRQKVSDQDVLRNARLNHDIYTYMIGWYDKINKQKPDKALLRQAFDCFEKSKGHMLLTQLSHKTLAAQLSVPDDVIEEGVELTRLETTTALSVSDPAEMNPVLELKQEYFEMLQDKYPEYYEKSYQPVRTDLQEVLEVLGENEALLSYQLKDSQLYVMVITQDTVDLERLQLTSVCSDAINVLNTLVHTRPSHSWNEIDIVRYNQTAQQIFSCVLGKIYPLISAKTQWWIAADGILELLPFEILLDEHPQEANEFHSLPYLVTRYDIGYILSATTWVRAQKQGTPAISDVAAFVHSDGSHTVRSFGMQRDGLEFQGMPGTAKAAASIRDVFGKRNVPIYANREATIPAFIQALSAYDVVHLGLHAYADTTGRQRHGIVFPGESSVLTVSDIIGKDIHASLVFLEGCETGVGKQARGEGTLNFARPFIAAGARHVLASRWKLDDQVAGEMSGYFYQQLKAGQNVAAANCEAKRLFLQNARRLQAHPYYWAAVMSVQ